MVLKSISFSGHCVHCDYYYYFLLFSICILF